MSPSASKSSAAKAGLLESAGKQDVAAAAVAAALGADTLVILSDVPGLLRDFPDEGSLIERLGRDEIASAQETWAKGRMKIKLLGAQEALDGGVTRVILGNSNGQNPVRAALDGKGTTIE